MSQNVSQLFAAQESRARRNLEMEVDAQIIREARVAGMPSKEYRLLKELKTAAQSFVDMHDSGRMPPFRGLAKHVEWFRELLK